MCGIAGLIGVQGDVAAMCAALVHRGPDSHGISMHEAVTIGVRRLAIVDLELGHQPMTTEDRGLVIVFNGEIYNAPLLRRELEAEGVRFKTRSDTEVILRLFQREPEDVERRLVGMWAFGIHDRQRGKVILSRDRFGAKPLYIVERGDRVAFASDLRAFAPVKHFFPGAFDVDARAAHAMLSWSYVPEESTIYAGVTRLAPGTRTEIDVAGGARKTTRYWSPAPSQEAARVRTLNEACELVEPVLRRAVKEHLESDVPIASFLSGGVDSSLVTALAAEHGRIHAYSIGFHEQRFDESAYARSVAAQIGLKHDVIVIDEAVLKDALADALLAYDEPFGDSSSVATFVLARTVGRTYKVALSGDGGDEAFAGYKKYRIVVPRRWARAVPLLRDAAAGALLAVPARTDYTHAWNNALRIVRRVARGLKGDDATSYVALTQVAPLERTRPLVRGGLGAEAFEARAAARFHAASGSELQRCMAADLGNVLPNDMLVKIDRAAMAVSLEARVPFLDHRVVEIGLGLPQAFTLGRRGKSVLRELYARRFGKEGAYRPKKGFGVPIERWLGTTLAPACDALFESRRLDRDGVLASETLGEGRWRRLLVTDAPILWHAFALAAWCEATLGDGPEALRDLLR